MLRRADNCELIYRPPLFIRNGRRQVTFRVGKNLHAVRRMTPDEYGFLWSAQSQQAQAIGAVNNRIYWLCANRFYWENDGLAPDEVTALVMARLQRERGQIDRAKAMFTQGNIAEEGRHKRDTIPDDVKQYVWQRDGGRCQNCGSKVELQFDHIIPVALGGSSSEGNLQILCGPCNRRKGSGLGSHPWLLPSDRRNCDAIARRHWLPL